jgi:hypothetical protein
MVLCTPFEVFVIARYLLDKKTSAEVGMIRKRLADLAHLPLDPDVRYDAQRPCALLDDNRCTVYEQRPSVCRTMLSASKAALRVPLQFFKLRLELLQLDDARGSGGHRRGCWPRPLGQVPALALGAGHGAGPNWRAAHARPPFRQ